MEKYISPYNNLAYKNMIVIKKYIEYRYIFSSNYDTPIYYCEKRSREN